MHKLAADNGATRTSAIVPAEGSAAAASLVSVLWQRRKTLALTVLVCLMLGVLYLLCATKVYTASAKVLIEQNGPRVSADNTGFVNQSESFMQSQADALYSSVVIQRALDAIDYRSRRMFAKVHGDPVAWLREGGLDIEVGRKSDVMTVSMMSPY